MRLFGWSKKFYFLEVEIRWPKKKAFDHENHFTLLFSLQSISGKWERERARARSQSPVRDLAVVDRNLQSAISRRRWSRSREGIEIAIVPSIAISNRDRRRGHQTGFSVVVDDFFLGCGLCFSGFVFSFFFSKHQKIFFGKFFEMQPNTWKYFPFLKISISGKYIFFGNANFRKRKIFPCVWLHF